jgi:hypothetical protein
VILQFVPQLGGHKATRRSVSFLRREGPEQPLSTKRASYQRNEDMGFFSSRKAEDNDNYLNTTSVEPNDKSVVHVIRSRFVSPFSFDIVALDKTLNGSVFTSSTGRTKAKNAKASQQLHLRHMAHRPRRPCQTPRVPNPTFQSPPVRLRDTLVPRRELAPLFYAARMNVQRCLRCQPRQGALTHRAWAHPLLHRPRLDRVIVPPLHTTSIPLSLHRRPVNRLTPSRTSKHASTVCE